MNRSRSTLAGLVALVILGLSAPAAAAPTMGPVTASAERVACFECLELTFKLEGNYDNPFDPR
jgi:hypothetical protein